MAQAHIGFVLIHLYVVNICCFFRLKKYSGVVDDYVIHDKIIINGY